MRSNSTDDDDDEEKRSDDASDAVENDHCHRRGWRFAQDISTSSAVRSVDRSRIHMYSRNRICRVVFIQTSDDGG